MYPQFIIPSVTMNPFSVVSDYVKRGTVLQAKTGEHAGEKYLLVRETDRAYNKDAAGNSFGDPQGLYNLVNLNTGKTRVSDPQRKLIAHPENGPTLTQLFKHFGIMFDVVGPIDNVMNPVQTIVVCGSPAGFIKL